MRYIRSIPEKAMGIELKKVVFESFDRWIVSSRGSHVVYKNTVFTTVQKYMKLDPVNVWIYDRKNKKRRQVTLRVSTEKNDKRKSEISTFVNFIHQLDAYFAIQVYRIRHPGLIIASLNFKKPYPGVEETELLSLSTLDMLNQYVYPSISGYGLMLVRPGKDVNESLIIPTSVKTTVDT
ncbi:hypothetical protein L1987_88291 [Smallanthus sonchifolius]|nr:hypothetical protein L1987_88291 [Smallanthus sonchifolius]